MERAGDWKGEEHGITPVFHVEDEGRMMTFHADEIGYFDPHLDEAMGKADIIQVGRDIYNSDSLRSPLKPPKTC